MKILMINTTDQSGGAANICFSLGDALKASGHEVKFLVGYKQTKRPDVDTLNFPGLLTGHHWTNRLVLYLRHLRSYISADDISFGNGKNLFSHPWFKTADIVHIHNRHGNFISLSAIKEVLSVKKLVWTMEDVWPITKKSAIVTHPNPSQEKLLSYPPMIWWPKQRLIDQKRHFFQLGSLVLIAPSKWLQTQTEKVLHRPVKIIPHGLPMYSPDIHKINSIKQSLSLPVNKKIALFTSTKQNAKDKGIDFFSQLAKTHHQTHEFIWVGVTKTNLPYIKTIPYQTSPKDFANILAIADLLIQPSKADIFGLVVLQALALGLPVLAFDIGGVSELITHKTTGYLAKLNDRPDLEAGFQFIAKNMRSKNTSSAKKIFLRYSLVKMADAYQKLYDELN